MSGNWWDSAPTPGRAQPSPPPPVPDNRGNGAAVPAPAAKPAAPRTGPALQVIDSGDSEKRAQHIRDSLTDIAERMHHATVDWDFLKSDELASEYRQTFARLIGIEAQQSEDKPHVFGTGADVLAVTNDIVSPQGWQDYGLARGTVSILAGDSDIGKSTILTWLLAQTFILGMAGPGGERGRGGNSGTAAGHIVYCQSDGEFRAVADRLRALGVDIGRNGDASFLFGPDYADSALKDPSTGQPIVTGVLTQFSSASADHWRTLERAMQEAGDGTVFVIDDFTGWSGCADESKPSAAIPLYRLALLATRHRTIVVVVHHLRKRRYAENGVAIQRTLDDLRGSTALKQAARCIYMLDCPDPADKAALRFAVAKLNYGPKPDPVGFRRTGPATFERMAVCPTEPKRLTKADECAAWLRDRLKDEWAYKADLDSELRDQTWGGHSLQERARKIAGVQTNTAGPGKPSRWWLADNAWRDAAEPGDQKS